jgi:hypothetical protein
MTLAPPELLLCKDCVWVNIPKFLFLIPIPSLATCMHPTNIIPIAPIAYITGKLAKQAPGKHAKYCENQRAFTSPHYCGPEGLNFYPKFPPQEPPLPGSQDGSDSQPNSQL